MIRANREGRLSSTRAWQRLGFFFLAIACCGVAGAESGLSQKGEQERRVELVQDESSSAIRGGKRWAVIVGIDAYESEGISRLSGAAADARAIASALVQYAEFPAGQVFLLTSDGLEKPTHLNVIERFEAIKQAAADDDLLLFFFAGHGVQVEGERYLLTYDAKIGTAAEIKVTSLSATKLRQEIESLQLAHRIIMVDACRDDPTAAGGRARTFADAAYEAAFTLRPADERGVRATFLSSSRGQSAYEWAAKGRGFFSYYLEEGIAGAAATRGKVTFTSLIDYLNEFVPRAVREQVNRDQIPYTTFEGPPFVLVSSDKISKTANAFDRPALQPSARTVYGIVKDSQGLPVPLAAVRVSFGARSRSTTADVEAVTAMTDEDGFFRVEGVPPGDEATVTISKEAFAPKSVVSRPEEVGKKLVVFLPRMEPAEPEPEPAPVSSASAPAPAPAKTTVQPAAPGGAELALVAYRTFLAEDFHEAERDALATLEVAPDEPLANAVLGNVLAVQGINSNKPELTKKAERFIQKALDQDPDLVLALNAKAVTLIAGGRRRDAQKVLERAVQLDPEFGVARGNLGHVYKEEGELADAEREYRAAIRLHPEGAINYNGLSGVLHLQKRYKQMEQACRDAISRYQLRDRNLGLFYVQLATALHERGRRDQSLETVSRAKALGVTQHPAFELIEKRKRGKK